MPETFDVPEDRAFSHQFTVEASDIDLLGHVNNVRWIDWVQRIAILHSTARGWDMAAYQKSGLVWVVRRHEIDYLLPAKEKEELVGTTWVEGLRRTSCVRKTLFLRRTDQTCMVRAATIWVLVDQTGRPCPVPKALSDAFYPGDIAS